MASFPQRVVGVLGLDASMFEEIEADRHATGQALAVVLLASVGAGLGNMGLAFEPRALVIGSVLSLAAWMAGATLVFYLGTRLLAESTTKSSRGELLRTLGFASAPGMFRAFEMFGQSTALVFPLTSLWMLCAMVIGVRQALDFSGTARAVAVCALGAALSLAVAFGLGLFMSVPVF